MCVTYCLCMCVGKLCDVITGSRSSWLRPAETISFLQHVRWSLTVSALVLSVSDVPLSLTR